MDLEIKRRIALWFRRNSELDNNVKDFLINRICSYAKEKRPAEQIVGMVTLLDDLLTLDEKYLQQ